MKCIVLPLVASNDARYLREQRDHFYKYVFWVFY